MSERFLGLCQNGRGSHFPITLVSISSKSTCESERNRGGAKGA